MADQSLTIPTPPPLPVTLLSGFLGAGKTTLLLDILRNKQGLRCAVIVNDMAALNIDAAIVSKAEILHRGEELIKLQNGCICCTLRGDLLIEINRIACTKQYDYLIIESTGISEPMQVAETFAAPPELLAPPEFHESHCDDGEVSKAAPGREPLGSLVGVARLDTCVTVVDASNFFDYVESVKFLKDEFPDADDDDTDRSVATLLIEQVEFSNVVVLNKTNLVCEKTLDKLKGVVRTLNPTASIIATNFSKVPLEKVLNTGLFDLEAAQRSPGWLQSLTVGHTPETEEYGISSFLFNSNRPFHAQRLFDHLVQYYFLLEVSYEEEGDGEEELDMECNAMPDIAPIHQLEERCDHTAEAKIKTKDEYGSQVKQELGWPQDTPVAGDNKEIQEVERQKRLAARLVSPFRGLLRSKGYFWLATRPHFVGEWGQAGAILKVDCAGPWDTEKDGGDDTEGSIDDDKDNEEDYPSPHQDLVFIGCFEANEKNLLIEKLEACLLTDEELKLFDSGDLSEFEDPWEEWPPSDTIEDEETEDTSDDKDKRNNEDHNSTNDGVVDDSLPLAKKLRHSQTAVNFSPK